MSIYGLLFYTSIANIKSIVVLLAIPYSNK